MTSPAATWQPSADALDQVWSDYRRTRDQALFAQVVDACQPLVVAIARRYLRRSIDVEDAAQEAFIRLLRYADQVESPRAWLYTCTRSVAVDLARRIQRPGGTETSELLTPDSEDAQRWDREDLRILDACLHALSASDRAVVIAVHLEGCSQQEVATRLGISQAAVSKRLHGALQRLEALCRKHGVTVAGLLLLCQTRELWTAEPLSDLTQRLALARPTSTASSEFGLSHCITAGLVVLVLAWVAMLLIGHPADVKQRANPSATSRDRVPVAAQDDGVADLFAALPTGERFLAWEPWRSESRRVTAEAPAVDRSAWLTRAQGTAVRLQNRRYFEYSWAAIPLGGLATAGSLRLDLQRFPETCPYTGLVLCVPTVNTEYDDRLLTFDEEKMHRLLMDGIHHELSATWEVRGGAVRVRSLIDDEEVASYDCSAWPRLLVIGMRSARVELADLRPDFGSRAGLEDAHERRSESRKVRAR